MRNRQPALLPWLVMMFGGGAVCLLLAVVAIDQLCYSDVVSRQPFYPGGVVVESDYTLFRARALGQTRLTLATSDDIETVREWLREQNLELLRAERFRGLADLSWRAETNSGEGSLLYYSSSCGE